MLANIILGILFLCLGYQIWKKEKISLLHSYHYDKVSEENKKNFCFLSGMGLMIIGADFGITVAFYEQ